MRKWALLLLFLPSIAKAGNLNSVWATDNYKMARQDKYPNNNILNTLTRIWDGTTVKPFGAKGEEIGFGIYLLGGSADATSVNVQVGTLSGPGGNQISPVHRLLAGTTNFNDPYEVFVATYVQIVGTTKQSWELEYEERDLPPNMRVPCTVNANNDCIPNSGTQWSDRPDHFKFYPDALVPLEAYQSSSFTVAASSSQLVWFDIYVDTNLVAGTYTGNITITEGAGTDFTIPISLLVYNFILPAKPSFTVIADRDINDIGYRHGQGTFCSSLACDTLEQHYDQFLHHHKIIPIGDDNLSQDYLNNVDYPRFTGSLYSGTSNYTVGPGINTPDSVYSIGTYGGWHGSWGDSQTNSTTFCSHVSNWENYFKTNFPIVRSFLYLDDEPASLTNTNIWSTWMATVTACQVSGYTTHRWVTSEWPDVQASAPNVDNPTTTGWINHPQSSWITAATNYETAGATQAWAYNGHPSWAGSNFATEDSGASSIAQYWAYWSLGVQGHFLWETTYFADSDNGGSNNNGSPNSNPLWTQARTFGYYSSFDTLIGSTGFNYSQGDGLLVYPGNDTIYPAYQYHMDGPIATFRLKMVRRGIQDVDYMTLAHAINPTLTNTLVSNQVGAALWNRPCFTLSDCTYTYGGRNWSEDPNTWLNTREQLAQIIAAATNPINNPRSRTNGAISIKGSVTIQ